MTKSKLNEKELTIIRQILNDEFLGTKNELIFDGGFFVGNRYIENSLVSFKKEYQRAILSQFFEDEKLIERIIKCI